MQTKIKCEPAGERARPGSGGSVGYTVWSTFSLKPDSRWADYCGITKPTRKERDRGKHREFADGRLHIGPVQNEMWSFRAVHGGNPTDLQNWVRKEPEMLFGASREAILVGGNARGLLKRKIVTEIHTGPNSNRIFRLANDLKDRGVPVIYVLGIPKRRCQEDPSQGEPRTSRDGSPLRDACKPGENKSIAEVNDL